MADQIQHILKEHWGYDSFRPMQEDIIRSVLDGKDTLALLPTGGGKSICFQVPAMAKEGICLVISPLIALMKDQVENLRRKNITAFSIFSGMTRKEVINTLELTANSNCKFLYVSPERLETKLFLEYLPVLDIQLIAVDESHCISQWGYDFRPPYLRIKNLREELPGVPVLALTASATPAVQEDICEKLGFTNPAIFRQSFARPNLSYSVFPVESKMNRLLEIVRKVNGSGIVYCRSRKRTKEISDLLTMHGIKADFYHAGLSQELRTKKQEDWINDKTRIIACTNAFGMGIDKPSVRIVVHADVPDCLENYYQEAGRAGRDGLKSYAVLLYDNKDIEELKALPASRYPALDTIRKAYSELMNFLQIPSGAGEGRYFSFDLTAFIRQTKLDTQETIACFKTLEQEEHLAFNDQVFIQSKIQFTTRKDRLYEFEEANPSLEPLIKSLLRSYEGIFDQPVTINETFIAGLNKRHVDLVIRDLQILHQAGILEYIPKKDSPQIYLFHPRVATQDLRIDMAAYNKRRKVYTERLQKMISFIHSTDCRSQEIGTYFGDSTLKPCGICDNCLSKKKTSMAEKEFSVIHDRVMQIIGNGVIHTNRLFELLEPTKKDRIAEVLAFMQGENKIRLNDRGEVTRY